MSATLFLNTYMEAEVLTLDSFRRTKFALPVRTHTSRPTSDEGEALTDILPPGKTNLPAVIRKVDVVDIDMSLLTRTIQFAAANLEVLRQTKQPMDEATRGAIMAGIRAMKDNLG